MDFADGHRPMGVISCRDLADKLRSLLFVKDWGSSISPHILEIREALVETSFDLAAIDPEDATDERLRNDWRRRGTQNPAGMAALSANSRGIHERFVGRESGQGLTGGPLGQCLPVDDSCLAELGVLTQNEIVNEGLLK
jgi:hypothetical protein